MSPHSRMPTSILSKGVKARDCMHRLVSYKEPRIAEISWDDIASLGEHSNSRFDVVLKVPLPTNRLLSGHLPQ